MIPSVVPLPPIDDGKNTIQLSREMTPEELKENNLAAPGVPRVGDNGKNMQTTVVTTVYSKCGTCSEAVDPFDKFCRNCGMALKRTCRKCGAENQKGKYCSECGKAIDGKKKRADRARTPTAE